MTYKIIGQDPDLVFGINCDQGIAGKSFDVSGNGFDADLVGSPQQGRDRFGSYLGFDGTGQRLDVSALDSFANGFLELTYLCIFSSVVTQSNKGLLGCWYANSNDIRIGLANRSRFSVQTSSGTVACDSNDSLNDGHPHFIAGTYNSNAGTDNVLSYVDGEVQADKETSTGAIVSTSKFNIANINDRLDSTYAFGGKIYAAAIYNTAKSAAWFEQEYKRFLSFQR